MSPHNLLIIQFFFWLSNVGMFLDNDIESPQDVPFLQRELKLQLDKLDILELSSIRWWTLKYTPLPSALLYCEKPDEIKCESGVHKTRPNYVEAGFGQDTDCEILAQKQEFQHKQQ